MRFDSSCYLRFRFARQFKFDSPEAQTPVLQCESAYWKQKAGSKGPARCPHSGRDATEHGGVRKDANAEGTTRKHVVLGTAETREGRGPKRSLIQVQHNPCRLVSPKNEEARQNLTIRELSVMGHDLSPLGRQFFSH
jgi:hypothetical protein